MKKIFTVLLVVLGVGVWNYSFGQKNWDGGAGTNSWHDADNWNPNGVPTSSDDISFFVFGSFQIDINSPAECNSIGGAAQTASNINLNSTFSIQQNFDTFSSISFNINSGSTVDYAGSGNQTVSALQYDNLTISGNKGGGTITLPSGDINVSGTLSNTATNAVFATSGNTFIFNGTSAQTADAFTYNILTINNGAGVTFSGDATVNGTLSLSNGTLNIGSNTLTLNATATATSGSLSSASDGTVIYASTSAQDILAGTYGNLTTSGNGKNFNGIVQIAGVATFGGTSHNTTGSTVEFNGASTQDIPAITYHNLTLSGNNTKTALGTTSITGNFQVDGSTTLDAVSNSAAFNFTGSTDQSINGGQFYILRLSPTATIDITLTGNIDVQNNLVINNDATLLAGNNTINVGGNWLASGIFTAGSSLVVFDGTDQDITPGSGNTFNDLEIASSGITTLLGNVDVDGNCTITSGTMSLDIYTLFLEGNLVNDGTFNGGTGTVNFDGANSSITGTNPVTFHNLTISSGETLIAPNQMFVQGNWTNNGSFDAGTGTVTFSGGNNQTTSGSTTFHNLTIDKTGGEALTLSTSSHGIDNILKLQNGQLNTGGNLTLFSNSSGTAKLAKVETGASISGNIIAQRYVGGSKTEGRYQFGPPVNDQTRTAWQDDLPTQFLPNSVLAYDEPSDNWVNPGSSTISPGTGVTVWVNNEDISGGEFNVDFTGPAVTGNVTIPLTSSGTFEGGGWNLVANPYPCTVDWDAASGWDKTAINNSIYFWNEVDESYNVYVGTGGSNLTGVGTGSATRYIPSGQAFFVKASSAGNLTVNENVKVTTENPTFLRKKAPDSLLRITLYNSTDKKDEAIIRFVAGTTDTLDGNADAVKWYGNILNISSLTPDGEKLVVNSMPGFNKEKIIPLEVKSKKTGKFKMAFAGIASFNSTKIHLRDKFLNKTVEITDQLLYEFSITSEAASHGTERFEIIFSTPLMFTFNDQEEKVGDLINVPLLVENFANLVSGQLSVVWDPNQLKYEGLKDFGLSTITEGNFGTTQVDQGVLTFSWDQPDLKGQILSNGDSLFSLEFRMKSAPGDSSYIFVSDDPVMVEFADVDLNNVQTEIDTGWIKSLRKIWLTGKVKDAADQEVANVKMLLEGNTVLDTLTNAQGSYIFEIFEGEEYGISGEIENNLDEVKNGISTIDIALIRRHILNKKLFDQPFAYLAADVDNNKLISTLDIAHLRSLILGKSTNLPTDKIWKIMPNSLESNPFDIPESVLINDFVKDTLNFNFTAFKLGDVDYSSLNSNVRLRQESFVEIGVPAIHASKDSIISIPLQVRDFYNISAFQFTVKWDPKMLEFLQLDDNHLNVQTGQQKIRDGFLPVIWDDFGGSSINLEDGKNLIALKFKVIGDAGTSSSISINSGVAEALVADRNLQKLSLSLNSGSVDIFDGGKGFQVLQNYPNPFLQDTMIPFIIPTDGEVELTIYDSQGRIIHRTLESYQAGYNEIIILDNHLPQSGLFHYKLNFGGIIRTKQMLMN